MTFRFKQRKGGREERETYRPRIPIQITTRESLIRAVEECKMSLFQKYISKLAPLVLCWVYTSWIMCACVQEEYRSLWGGLECVDEAVEVEPDGRGVVVWVSNWVDTDVAENCEVVYCEGQF